MIAIKEYGLAYAAVPKAGCSSVKAMLAQIDPEVSLPPDETRDSAFYHGIYQTQRYRKDRFDAQAGSFRFTLVRDPIRRLMSVYTNRVVDLKDLYKSRQLRRQTDLTLDPDPDTFFLHFRDYSRQSSVIRHHILPTALFTGDDLAAYDKVYLTGQMGEVAEMLSQRSGKPVELTKANSSETKLAFDDLRAETRDALRPYLEDEYRHLDGYVQNPFA
ncbi:sulfotransferase family 2 domain-containing protein [Arenibacterium sp. CAU 1754]